MNQGAELEGTLPEHERDNAQNNLTKVVDEGNRTFFQVIIKGTEYYDGQLKRYVSCRIRWYSFRA